MLKSFALAAGAATCALALSACQDQASQGGGARDYISAVGSSTVYPFATAAGEKFAEATGNKTPKIDSTGSGGGFARFFQGVGGDTPDISNASRRLDRKSVVSGKRRPVREELGGRRIIQNKIYFGDE